MFRFVLLSLVVLLPSLASAQSQLLLGSSSEMHLSGGFTLGHWSCHSQDIYGDVVLPSQEDFSHSIFEQFQSSIYVEVRTFSCGSRPMEADMYHALKSSEHPIISYIQKRVTSASSSEPREGDPLEVISHGVLEVAGVRKEVEFQMQIIRIADHVFEIKGSGPMKMKNFGIKPPTALFGLIRADNNLDIQFTLDLHLAKAGQ